MKGHMYMIKTTVNIDGMTCSMCESHVNDCIRNSFRVKSVKSSHAKGECVIISDSEIDTAGLKSAIEAVGYKVLSVETGEYKKKSLFGFFGG